MGIRIIVLLLLICRVVSVVFLLLVLRIQWKLFARKAGSIQIEVIKRVLFSLTAIILLSNVFPLYVDILALFGAGSLVLTVIYAFSNALTAIASGVMLWLMYRIAEREEL